jgi:hypothetical protein
MTTTTPTPTASRSTTRVPKTELSGLMGSLLKRLMRKQLGAVPEPAEVFWHNKPVIKDMSAFGRKIAKWDQLAPDLTTYAHMAVASQVGCSWCLDFNYFHAHNEGLDERT